MEVRSTLVVLVLLCVTMVTHGAIDADLITKLPGLTSQPKFKQYSGYLKATGTRRLHYWFVESQKNPTADPLVVWMNGGPGCSSMDGFLSEHGPFFAGPSGKSLVVNPYSWNTVANMLYIEAPAGVGFSYAGDGNVTTDDDQTSLDNYWAIKYFLKNYPEFSKNDFFITGESYGGIYVPTLAARVVDDTGINFKGFAVGNGLSDVVMNSDSLIYFAYYHGLFGIKVWDDLLSGCCKGMNSSDCQFMNNPSGSCQNAVNEASEAMGSLNIYNLYAECYQGPQLNDSRISMAPYDSVLLVEHPVLKQERQKLLMLPHSKVAEVPPCIDASAATVYLNWQDVRQALHIPNKLPKWEICSAEVGMKYRRLYDNMRNQYMKILSTKKQRIMVYNGDVDMACNFLGDQWFVDSLNLKVIAPRTKWMYTAKDGSNQVAGFVKHFENLAFVTVKGSGHMVPQDKPIPALEMFKNFIQGPDLL